MPRKPYIDASGTGTFAQLQSLYADPSTTPQQVDSNLFLQDSRLSDWASRSAQAAGIGNDPARFFQQQANQRASAVLQTQRDAARLAGYSPDTSPEYIHRQQVEAQIAAADQQRQQVASLQAQQQREQTWQMPTTGYHQQGGAPILSPLAMQEAERIKMEPMEYLLRMRSGSGLSNLEPANTPFNPTSLSAVPFIPKGTKTAVDPDTLYKDSRFHAHLQYNPQHAQGLFSALTGQDYKGYQDRKISTDKENFAHSKSFIQKMVEDQNLRQREDGSWEQRQLVKSLTGDGVKLGDQFGTPSPQIMEHINRAMGAAFPLEQERQDMHAERAAAAATAAAADKKARDARMATMVAQGRSLPAPTNTEGYESFHPGTVIGGMAGIGSDIADLFTWNFHEDRASRAPMVQTGANPVRVRKQLQNDPVFAALMQRNPASAREYIARLQKQNVVPIPPVIQPPYFPPF